MLNTHALKTILLWGILLFVFNYLALLVFMFILGESTGSRVFWFVELLIVGFAGYKGVLSYANTGTKEKTHLIKSNFINSAEVMGGMIAVVSSLLFILAAFVFSGELAFKGLGILMGAAGGYQARQKLQKVKQ